MVRRPEPDIKLDLFGGTSGTYAGLDRFDRVIDQRWFDYGSSADVDRFKYGYDRASNRNWRENTVSKNLSTPVYLDEFYTYDGLHRLKTMDRGELNGTKTGITGTPAREEDWTLDPLGNWSGYVQKTSGTTDLDQDRSVNKVNEITDISETTGTSWITPSYDKNGNMSVVPRPDDLANGYTCTYDAWNRLVKVEAGISTVAEYSYDGLHRRVTKTTDSTVRHVYYTSSWQAIEERLGSSTSADRQFIWGPLYIDHLILRDRDTDANGTLDQRLYALQDANWNVTALTNTAGDAVERYGYDAYGTPTVMTDAFGSRTDSDYDWDRLSAGYCWDSDSGLYSVRNRHYHPVVGSWLSRDPIEYVNSEFSFYTYVVNAPLNSTDPEGLRGPITLPPPVRPSPVRPGPRPLPFPGRPFPGPHLPPNSPPVNTLPPLPYPYPTPLPPGYPQGPGPHLQPLPGTKEWEDYARRCWREYRADCRNDLFAPACPQPVVSLDESVRSVANRFLADLQFLGIIPYSVNVEAVNCRPVQAIIPPSPICGGQAGATFHCKALVTSHVGVWVTGKDIVSVFVCRCCDTASGNYAGYAKPFGTPAGQGAPHLPGGNKGGDISR